MKRSTVIAIITIALAFAATLASGCTPGAPKATKQPAGLSGPGLPGNISGLNFPTDLAITDDGNIYFTVISILPKRQALCA